MKINLFLLGTVFGSTRENTKDSVYEDFNSWCEQWGYSFDEEDAYMDRYKIWKEHSDFIESTNYENFVMSLNQFAHLSPREWYSTDFLLADEPQTSSCQESSFAKNTSAPDSIDWRKMGAVLPVMNQGSIGKSAYFATTDTISSIWYNKTGDLVPLSIQQLNDCSKNYYDLYQFPYVIDAKGIESAKDYVPAGGKCNFDTNKVTAKIHACYNINKGDEEALKNAIAQHGPIAVSVDASNVSFQLYQSGIYYEPKCSDIVNHAMVIVGYGTENNNDYWIVKNSWGTSWGENGYIRMARNRENNCGIASFAAYPTL